MPTIPEDTPEGDGMHAIATTPATTPPLPQGQRRALSLRPRHPTTMDRARPRASRKTSASTRLSLLESLVAGADASGCQLHMLARLQGAARRVGPSSLAAMSDGERFDARSLSYILAQVLTGGGLQLLINTEAGSGFEAWRQLVRREERSAGSAPVAQLTALRRTMLSSELETHEDDHQVLRIDRPLHPP